MAGRTTKLYIDQPVQQNIQVAIPFYIIVEEYKVGKTRLVMTLKDSKDEKVRAAGVAVKTGRKWSASKAVTEAECRLRHKDIVGTVAQGRQGALEHQRAATGTRRTLKRDETWYNERSSVQRRKINRQRQQNQAVKEPGQDGTPNNAY